ncbi:MAG: hypothetical protein H6624_02595 [Bdellovibrionaceae bacterium]|nr:hypothetical protein [Bdellovibrionales bacterium]MCB9083200.1 hypothetical protein [Pseudobdellovibrionaceae bacterium]
MTHRDFRSLAANMWAQRAQAELGAQARFRLLIEQLEDHGAHAKVTDLAKRAFVEEEDHAHLCAQIARDLGHSSGFAEVDESETSLQPQPSWRERESEADRLLCEVTLMCCITETINASLMNTIYAGAKDTPAKKIVHRILRDEVKHGQMGWGYLTSESQRRDCSLLSRYLGEMLEISVKDELFAPIPFEIQDAELVNFGVLPVSMRMDQFAETLTQVVIPGFEHFNVDSQGAKDWYRAKVS